MGKREKRAYLEAIRGRYRKSDRAGKAAILDEFCAICGFNRKYAIRLLGKPPGRTGRKPGKKPVYGVGWVMLCLFINGLGWSG